MKIVGGLMLALAGFAIACLMLVVGWNNSLAELFGLPRVTIWNAAAFQLLVLGVSFLFKTGHQVKID